MKNIVIVGGSFAGVGTAHRVLKQAAKQLPSGSFKITLVSQDSHLYWSIASPRGIISGQLSDDQLFQPIAPGFTQYPAGSFEFVLATATGIDVDKKTLEVVDPEGNAKAIAYDYLLLGTGARANAGAPFKSLGSTEKTKAALHEYQAKIKAAKKIVVVGAGPTGVEVAGELAFEYGLSKEITLITSGPAVLDDRPANMSNTSKKHLEALKVNVRLNTKVEDTIVSAGGAQELTLSGGEKLITDLVIPTYGVTPNSSFIPAKFLDPKGFVNVDEYFRVKGAEGVFAIGDVANIDGPQLLYVEKHADHMAKNLILALKNTSLLPYKAATGAMMGLQIGKKAGAGHVNSWTLPGFIVTMLRKTLFIERLPKLVNGSLY
ncbi:hypothetical protein F5Y14DRAFT_456428 [Nemania sp. NC0429]|nr:hypothetical protein F5Y14DRAFT_456428 [Nemania sp. NC0429]